MLIAAAVVLLVVVGALAVASSRAGRRYTLAGDTVGDSSATVSRTLAVLPFVNTSGEQNDDYFSDGLTDELAHALGRLPGLRIAGRTSSYRFKGQTPTAQEVDWAKRVVETFESNPGSGVLTLDGKMLDKPHLTLARRLLGRTGG